MIKHGDTGHSFNLYSRAFFGIIYAGRRREELHWLRTDDVDLAAGKHETMSIAFHLAYQFAQKA